MRLFYLLLSLIITPIHVAADTTEDIKQTRFAIGFYYPAIENISNRTDIEVSLTYWAKELSAGTFELENVYSVLYDNITEMNSAFRQGKLDMVVAPPLLLATHFERALLVDGFVGVTELNELVNVAIIARTGSSVAPKNYQNKRLLLPENDLLAEVFIDKDTLIEYSRPYQQVFSEIQYARKHRRIILDLFFGKADFAVVYENALQIMTELNPQVGQKIKVLKRFPMKARNYAYFHRDYRFIKELKSNVKLFNKQIRGQQILQVFQSTEVDNCRVEELDSFDEFYQDYLKLKNTMHD